MADSIQQPGNTRVGRDWIASLARNPRPTGIALFVAAALLAAIPVYFGTKYKLDYLSVCVWGATLALLALIGGVWYFTRPEPRDGQTPDVEGSRLMVLTIGGLAGFATAILGLALAWHWWNHFTGGLDVWRKEWPRIWTCLAAVVAGLAVMFVSLQLARTDERTSPTLRRLLYGYNAVLTGLLLLAILGVFNVLSYVRMWPFSYLNRNYDWTASTIYTLSPGSRTLLEHLDKPVKVYVLIPLNDTFVYQEVSNLMKNCQAVTDKVEVEYLSPDLDLGKIQKLQNDYQILPSERQGLLVVYGSGAQAQHEFIPYTDIFAESPGADRFSNQVRFQFKGEDALMKKINYMEEGKSKAVVYFTQGSGEFDLNGTEATGNNVGLSTLKDRLEKGNYEVKELKLGPKMDWDPVKSAEHGDVVVVARPATRLPENGLKALRTFMNPPPGDKVKKGKLIVLTDALANPDGSVLQTGLEGLLSEFTIELGDQRILSLDPRAKPGEIIVVADPRSRNSIASAFNRRPGMGLAGIIVDNARRVTARPEPPAGPGGSRFTQDNVLLAPAGQGLVEAKLKADPEQYLDQLRKLEESQLESKISQQSIPVGVAVAEPAPFSPGGDPHDFMKQRDQKPRLVVFGAANWISNTAFGRGRGQINAELFSYTLEWLREKPTTGSNFADPKERSVFTLNLDSGGYWGLVFVPVAVLGLCIVGLGGGVWVVRRR